MGFIAAPAQPAISEQPAPQQPQPGGRGENLDRVIAAGLMIITSPDTRGAVINDLKEDGAPDDVLARTVIGIFKVMIDKSQGKMPVNVMKDAATALVLRLGMLAKEAGLLKLDKQTMLSATQKAVLGVGKLVGAVGGQQPPPQQPTQPQQPPQGLLDQPQPMAA